MAYELIATHTFEQEYDGALEYLVETLQSPSSASKLMEAVSKAADLIADNPKLSALSTKPMLGKLQLREWQVSRYIIVYRVEGNRVYFEHFYHELQDFEQLV